ncbi:MAG: cytochrome-c peroxidase, partial [Bacteroidota bacterium]
KVPTLRNIAITYPYLHDGSVLSLEEIIDSYAHGGKRYKTQSDQINGFALSAEERNDLVVFLHTLTDNRFLENEP